MVRTALGADGIGKRLPGAALHALLQLGLVVLDMVDLPLGQTVEDVREDKTLRRLEPAIKIHGGDDRLHCVGKDGRPLSAAAALLPVAEADIVAQMQRERHTVQRLLTDELGPQAAHLPLRHVGIELIEPRRRDHAEHGIAQKLEPLVAGVAPRAVLIGIGAVHERMLQQPPVAECVAQTGLQRLHQSLSFAACLSTRL